MANRRVKRIGGFLDPGTDELILGAGALIGGYILIVKPLLANFGLTADQQAAISDIDSAPPAQNPFNAQYQPFVDFATTALPPGQTLAQYFSQLNDTYNATSNPPFPIFGTPENPLDVATAAEIIRNQFNFLTIGDTSVIDSVFSAFNSKEEVSAVAAYLYYVYGDDLWTLLKKGRWYNIQSLSGTDLANIIARLNNLPDVNP